MPKTDIRFNDRGFVIQDEREIILSKIAEIDKKIINLKAQRKILKKKIKLYRKKKVLLEEELLLEI